MLRAVLNAGALSRSALAAGGIAVRGTACTHVSLPRMPSLSSFCAVENPCTPRQRDVKRDYQRKLTHANAPSCPSPR